MNVIHNIYFRTPHTQFGLRHKNVDFIEVLSVLTQDIFSTTCADLFGLKP